MKKNQKRSLFHWIIIVSGGLFLILLAGYIYIAYLLPIPDSLVLRPRNVSTKIYDRNGQMLFEVLSEGAGRKSYIKLQEMPEKFVQAIIAGEDSNYYEHIGVDPAAIGRALFYNYLEQKITSGASTITQQLVRNLLGTNRERNFQEKLLETIYAIRLSNGYSKEQILEEYLNTVYFGNLSYGAGEAAKNYFNKNLRDLDLAEITILAGLPKSPSTYNPLVNPEKAKKRQQYVLSRMVELGYITETEAKEAGARQITYASGKTAIAAPHFVHKILAETEEKYGEDYVHSGLSIYTTLDLNMQNQAQRIIDYQLDKLKEKNVGSAAMLAATVPDGQILVWIGSKDYFNDEIDGQVDIINSLRQPGSALKPFLYLLALENGDTLASIIEDLPIKVKTEGGVYSPLNYDLDFHGPVRLREALANSFNIPAVRTQEKLGTANFLRFLHKFGLTTLDQPADYYGLALTLGGGEIRMVDLANAYLTLAGQGKKRDFTTILRIEDATGKKVYEYTPAPTKNILKQFGEENSSLIIDTLSDPNARLKSFGEGNMLELSIPAAVKTGTTRNFRDNWTFGFSPYLLTSVWVGNADATPMENISGIDGAGPIWHDFMEYYHEQNETRHFQMNRGFPKSTRITEISVCAVSGLLPGENCQEQIKEYFLRGTEPSQTDFYWKKYSCPSSNGKIAERYFIDYPYPYDSWASDRGYFAPPECNEISELPTVAENEKSAELIQIKSPLNDDSFEIISEIPLESQKIPIKVLINPTHKGSETDAVKQITIFVDNNVLKTIDISDKITPFEIVELWLPTRGEHSLKIDQTSLNDRSRQVVKYRFFVR